jgi:hypothetical protein
MTSNAAAEIVRDADWYGDATPRSSRAAAPPDRVAHESWLE